MRIIQEIFSALLPCQALLQEAGVFERWGARGLPVVLRMPGGGVTGHQTSCTAALNVLIS